METNREYTPKEKFALNLKIQMQKKNVSAYKIRKDTGITHSYIYDLCDPENKKMPSMNMMEKIAKYLEIEVEELLSAKNLP